MSHSELKRLGQQVHQAGIDLQRMLHGGRELQAACQSAVAGELNVAALEPSLQGQVAAAREEVASLQQSVQDLEMEQQDLYAAVDRKAGEAARIQRQVTIMAAVRPAHQDEFEALQAELVRLFTLYQSRVRNLDWLDSQLDARRKAQAKQASAANRKLKQVQQKLWEQEQQQLLASDAEHGDAEASMIGTGNPGPALGVFADDSSEASTLGNSSDDEADTETQRVGSPMLSAGRPASRAGPHPSVIRPMTAGQHIQRLASSQGPGSLQHAEAEDADDDDDNF